MGNPAITGEIAGGKGKGEEMGKQYIMADKLRGVIKDLKIDPIYIAQKSGHKPETIERWLKHNRMPKFMELVCDGFRWRILDDKAGLHDIRHLQPLGAEEAAKRIAKILISEVYPSGMLSDSNIDHVAKKILPILRDLAPEVFIEAAAEEILKEYKNVFPLVDVQIANQARERLFKILRTHLREAAPLEGELRKKEPSDDLS